MNSIALKPRANPGRPAEKKKKLTGELRVQLEAGQKLNTEIKKQLKKAEY